MVLYRAQTSSLAIFYKYANRNARLGVLTAFIATCVGYGTGIMFNNIDLLLGMSTQASASLDVDKSYVYNISSSLYLMLGSTVILASFHNCSYSSKLKVSSGFIVNSSIFLNLLINLLLARTNASSGFILL